MRISPVSILSPDCFCSWVVMNVINGIVRGDSPCALVPLRGANAMGEEQTLWERNICKLMCIVGERIQGLKGFQFYFNLKELEGKFIVWVRSGFQTTTEEWEEVQL